MIKIKALILCAGYATRLYPLTLNTPKPLLKIAGKPIIEYILEQLRQISIIDQIYIVTNSRFYPNFTEWLSSYTSKKPIEIINDQTTSNDDRLGAVKDINLVISQKRISEDLLVIAGDNFSEFSLESFVSFFKQKGTSIALCDLKDKSLLANRFGTAVIDKTSRIIDFEEKPKIPKSTLAATASYLYKKEDLPIIKECAEQESFDAPGHLFIYISKRKPAYGFVFKERWLDIGTKEDLEKANQLYSRPIK